MVLAVSGDITASGRIAVDSFGLAADSAVAVVTLESGCDFAPGMVPVTLLVRVPWSWKPVQFAERAGGAPECW
jgi:hypothetical protein